MYKIRYTLPALIWSFSLAAFAEHSFLTYRSQGVDLARYNASWLNRCTRNNAVLSVTYMQSFDACALSSYYFGANTITFSGSRVANRNSTDILADYYGLPTDFQSSLSFNPTIKNVITDIDLYWLVGCSDNPRFTVRAIFPVAYTQWDLNPCERVIDAGTADYPAGYMSPSLIAHDDLPSSALAVLTGSQTFGDLTLPLYYGRIPTCHQSKTKLADIFFACGYNAICRERGMLTVDINTTIPTGTISHARTLFEPQVGNGHHWGLGIGLSGWGTLWSSAAHNSKVAFNIDTRVQHLFASTQKRSYDLINNGPGSRYMLLEDMAPGISIAQGFSPTFPQPDPNDLLTSQYIDRLVYAIDAMTFDSKIKIDLQAEVMAKISAIYKRMNVELGYNFWIRTKEKLACREPFRHRYYGIKGDAQIYGFLPIGLDLSLPINATQSQATVHAPQGSGNTINNFINANADNPALLYNIGPIGIQQTVATSVGPDMPNTGVTALDQVNGSRQAVTLTDADINNCSGLSPRALSHTVFGAVRYEWETTRTYPYMAVGAQGEFAGKTDCVYTAVSQWAVWVKGGVQY